MTTSEQTKMETPMYVVLLQITMWLVLFLGLIGVMVVYMLN